MHFNEFLNETVKTTFHMNRANNTNPRLPVEYKHRREIDRFYELPSHLRQQLPPCVESLIPSHHSIKVRVSYDEKTKDVLAKIIKARVADLDIFMPRYPPRPPHQRQSRDGLGHICGGAREAGGCEEAGYHAGSEQRSSKLPTWTLPDRSDPGQVDDYR